jgi:iron complex transport system ATP-binding protein
LLSARDVSFAYRGTGGRGDADAPLVVDGVSLDVSPGAFVGILGPNGSGKTTLLKVLAGLLAARSGSVTLDGTPVASWPRRALARRIALVPQEVHPAFDYSVLELALMGRYPHLGPFAVEGPGDVAIALESLGATGARQFEDRPFSTLSGGEKQRVVLAAALAQRADILLLDEPTASLDPGHQLDIATLLTTLNRERGLTLVLATHDLNLAAAVCRDLVLVRDGRTLASGATRDVLTGTNLELLYGIRADVRFHDEAGHLTVVPLARDRR